jgi:hypothetical protein
MIGAAGPWAGGAVHKQLYRMSHTVFELVGFIEVQGSGFELAAPEQDQTFTLKPLSTRPV